MNQFTENTPMPFGRFKDKAMKDVPDWYLKWLKKNAGKTARQMNRDLFNYIYDRISD